MVRSSPFFWRVNALRHLEAYAREYRLFRIEDVRVWSYEAGLHEPLDAAAWRYVSRQAVKDGTIVKHSIARAQKQTLKLVTVYRSSLARLNAPSAVPDSAFTLAAPTPAGIREHDESGSWLGDALNALRNYAMQNDQFTVEQLRIAVEDIEVVSPTDKRQWGSVVNKARKLGWLSGIGVQSTSQGKNNSTVWRSNL